MRDKNHLIMLLYYIIIIVLLFVIVISFRYPGSNLSSFSMIMTSVICLVVFMLLCRWWERIYIRVEKIEPYVYYLLLFLLGGMLFFVCSSRSTLHTNTLADYTVLYHTAGEFADGRMPSESSYYFNYFSNYDNNLRPMLMLSWLFKAADLIQVSRFHFVLFWVCLQVIGVAWGMGILVSKKENREWRLPTLLLFSLMLPMWCFSAVFYTDTMSMGLAVIAMAIVKVIYERQLDRCRDKKNICTFALLILLASILVALATVWKVTAIIPLIAFVMASILCKEKRFIKIEVLLLIGSISVGGLFSGIFNTYSIVQETKNTSDPLISWVAIGMKGNGTWGENSDFVHELHEREDTSAKLEFTKAYILENIDSFWDVDHILRKACRNFADGNLEAYIFTPVEDDGSVIWSMFNAWGKWSWRVSQVNFCYLEMIYLTLFLGAVVSLYQLYKGNKSDLLLLSTHISFLGIFIFLMMWEANSRQLYNQMPMLILGEMLFVQKVFDCKRD